MVRDELKTNTFLIKHSGNLFELPFQCQQKSVDTRDSTSAVSWQ